MAGLARLAGVHSQSSMKCACRSCLFLAYVYLLRACLRPHNRPRCSVGTRRVEKSFPTPTSQSHARPYPSAGLQPRSNTATVCALMLSFIIPARSQPTETRDCLFSVLAAVRSLRIEHQCEFILLDDESDPAHGMVHIFQQFRQGTRQPVTIVRFTKHQHYTGVFAHGLSLAKGDRVFFISNDMLISPSWLRTILAVASLDPTFGVVRGTADLVDSHEEHCLLPPFIPGNQSDVDNFSRYVMDQFGLHHTPDDLLSGDAICISRALLTAIGTFDKRFFGYFSDIDFGLRAQRAGFHLVCAKGAWLRHHAAGHIRAQREAENITQEETSKRRMALVQKAYELFRLKWDHSMPPTYRLDLPLDMAKLRAISKPKGFDMVPMLRTDAAIMSVV